MSDTTQERLSCTSPLTSPVSLYCSSSYNGPSDKNLSLARQKIAAWRQTRLNDIILEETRKACVSRDDHRLMLKQLISLAYSKDPHRKDNINKWKRILLAIEKEYLGANALLSLSPDPYQKVIAKLSSMMLWNEDVRHWTYEYHTDELTRRSARQNAVLHKLRESGKLFISV